MSRFYEDLYISWIIYIFLKISFQVTGRIGKSRLDRRLGFDLKQCLFDIKLKKKIQRI